MKKHGFSKAMIFGAALAVSSPLTSLAGGGGEASFSFQTESGKSYRGCKVLKVDPDGLTFSHSQGIAKIAFTELSEEMQKQHGYDKEKSDEFIKKHTEIVRKVVLSRRSQKSNGMAYYMPNQSGGYAMPYAYGGGYPYYADYGYGYGYGSRHGGGVHLRYPHYQAYPNLSFQVGSEQRPGSPIAPTLISPSNFQRQQNAIQNRAGFPSPRIPVIRPQITTPNRPGPAIKSAPRISRPAPVLRGK